MLSMRSCGTISRLTIAHPSKSCVRWEVNELWSWGVNIAAISMITVVSLASCGWKELSNVSGDFAL